MSAPDDVAVDQLHQALVGLAKTLGIDPDAPDAVAQFAAALLRLIPLQSLSPPKSRRKPTWRAGLYAELYQDVNQTKARLNCSYKDAIAHLREDRSGPWCKLTQQSLEPRYREARRGSRDRMAHLLTQQALSPKPEAPLNP